MTDSAAEMLHCPFCNYLAKTTGKRDLVTCSDPDMECPIAGVEMSRDEWNRRASPVVSRPASPGVRVPVELWREACDTVLASQAEEGVSSQRIAYRKDLHARMLSASPSSQGNGDGVPSHEAIAEMLPSILLDPSTKCPLCGKTGAHKHSPEEIVIYRNGVKYGRGISSAPHQRNGETAIETRQCSICLDSPPYDNCAGKECAKLVTQEGNTASETPRTQELLQRHCRETAALPMNPSREVMLEHAQRQALELLSHSYDLERELATARADERERLTAGVLDLHGLIAALRQQKQCDDDGYECQVSRQAVDEAITVLEAIRASARRAE